MEPTPTQKVELFVIFTGSQMNHWLIKRLMPMFQHCYTMQKTPGGAFWIIVNPKSAFTSVTIETVDDYPHPRLYSGRESVILPVRTVVKEMQPRHTLCIFNCVEVVKSLLGIRDFWLLTPRQLYKRLSR